MHMQKSLIFVRNTMISMKHANCYLMQFDHGSLNSLYFLRKSNDFCTCASAARHGSSAVQAPSRPQKSLKNHCYDNKSFKSVVPALVLHGFPDHTMRRGGQRSPKPYGSGFAAPPPQGRPPARLWCGGGVGGRGGGWLGGAFSSTALQIQCMNKSWIFLRKYNDLNETLKL